MIVTDINQLSVPCEPVKTLAEGLEVARRLQYELRGYNKHAIRKYRKSEGKIDAQMGIGLAANQIGIQKQVCLLMPRKVPVVLINPRIVAASGTRFEANEGCLSIPGEVVKTKRHQWVMVESMNNAPMVFGVQNIEPGVQYGRDLLLCVVAQHEISHLFGMTMRDFAGDNPPAATEWHKKGLSTNG